MSIITLDPIAEAEKSVLAHLLELEAHDLSEYVDSLRVNEHGLFGYSYLDSYWTEAGRLPYFIRADGALAGFVLIRGFEDHCNLAEFFVLRSYRRSGIGLRAAAAAFASHRGRWELQHAEGNAPAAAFWERVVSDAARGEIDRETLPDGHVRYRFATG